MAAISILPVSYWTRAQVSTGPQKAPTLNREKRALPFTFLPLTIKLPAMNVITSLWTVSMRLLPRESPRQTASLLISRQTDSLLFRHSLQHLIRLDKLIRGFLHAVHTALHCLKPTCMPSVAFYVVEITFMRR
jgi:hypothetical protein